MLRITADGGTPQGRIVSGQPERRAEPCINAHTGNKEGIYPEAGRC
jgi:hypothetical protein